VLDAFEQELNKEETVAGNPQNPSQRISALYD